MIVELVPQPMIPDAKLVCQVLFGYGRVLRGIVKGAQDALSNVMIDNGGVCIGVGELYLNPAIR